MFSSHFLIRLTLGKCWVFTISLAIKSYHSKCISSLLFLVRITSTALYLKQQLWNLKDLYVCFSGQSIPESYYYYHYYYFKFPSSRDFSLIIHRRGSFIPVLGAFMGLSGREFACLNYKTAMQDQSQKIPTSKLTSHFHHRLNCIEFAALWIIFGSQSEYRAKYKSW